MPPHTGPTMRTAAVAGLFYPGNAAELESSVRGLLAENPAQGPAPKALIAPHAGYVYSGPVAARAYNLLTPLRGIIRRVVLLGPAHRVALRGLALPSHDSFRTPLGEVPLDTVGLSALEGAAGVQRSDEAHRQEHSLEVHLPFLQTVLERFTLVPLVVGFSAAPLVRGVLERLWGGDETLVVVSSDLSHYHPYAEAQRLDADTAKRIEAAEIPLDGAQACGAYPLNGLLSLVHERKLPVTRLDLRNSGDTAGSRDRVVGYGAWSIGGH